MYQSIDKKLLPGDLATPGRKGRRTEWTLDTHLPPVDDLRVRRN